MNCCCLSLPSACDVALSPTEFDFASGKAGQAGSSDDF